MTAVIILNYNNWEDTLACIDSVEQFNTAPIKYIVVDNGSPRPGAVEALDEALSQRFADQYRRLQEGEAHAPILKHTTLLVLPTNDGYAQGNNKGLLLTYDDEEIEYTLILNNDTLFIEDIIPGLVKAYQTLPSPALVGPLLLKKDRAGIDYNCARLASTPLQTVYHFLCFYIDPFGLRKKWRRRQCLLIGHPELLEKESVTCDMLSGACILLSKQLFQRMGGLDPNTFLYNEENILYKRTQAMGLKTYIIPRLSLIHVGASSTNQSPGLFIMRCSRESTRYYINHYSGANRFERLLFALAASLLIPQVRLQKSLFKLLGIKR